MAVPEPSDAYGLWSRVKVFTDWPEPDEDAVAALAQTWRTSAARFAGAARHDLGPMATMWPDPAGQAFGVRAAGTLEGAATVSQDMGIHAAAADRFAAEIIGVKNGIRALIDANAERYATILALPLGVGGPAGEVFVRAVAGLVDGLIADAAGRISGAVPPARPGGPRGGGKGDGQPPPEGWRVVGDAAAEAGQVADDAVDSSVETAGAAGLGLLSVVGSLTGDEKIGAVAGVLPALTGELSDQAADRTLETAVQVRNDAYHLAQLADGKQVPVELYLSRTRHPESLDHVLQAQQGWTWTGATHTVGPARDPVLTIDKDKARADERRNQSTGPIPTARQAGVPGYDRDEYPPARSFEGGREEGGKTPSVKYIPEKDNRGSGSTLGHQAKNLNQGDKYIIVGTR